MTTLSNKYITARISEHGAELHSLLHNGFEYIWQADPKYWGRHAPILFPIVGRAHNTAMSQHGFARDMEFGSTNSPTKSTSSPTETNTETNTEATFLLQSNEDTLKLYPYRFELYVKYTLHDNRLTTTYTIHNTDDKDIFFQIGGHPAFNLPNYPFSRGYLQLLKNNTPLSEITVRHPNTSGYITAHEQHIDTPNGTLPITTDLFDNGALILEDDQCDTIRMMNGNGTTHLELTSNNAKLFGLWSPEHKNAPFVCIEPWLGRADSENYNGTFTDRPYTNRLKAGERLDFGYQLEIFDYE